MNIQKKSFNFFYLIIIMNNLLEFIVFILIFVSFFVLFGASFEYFVNRKFTQINQTQQKQQQNKQLTEYKQITENQQFIEKQNDKIVSTYNIPISNTLDFDNEPIINSGINANFDAEQFLGYVFFQHPQNAIGPYPGI